MTTVSNSGQSSSGAMAQSAPFRPEHLCNFVFKTFSTDSLVDEDGDFDDGSCWGGFETAYDSFPDLTT
jgi:hypothetical protein